MFVLLKHIGTENHVLLQIVLDHKHGMERDVSVDLDLFLMVGHAFSVLMVKYGMKTKEIVNVKMDINGMVNFVKNNRLVLEEEYGIVPMNNAYVLIVIFGQAIIVNQNQLVAVDKDLILKHKIVNALEKLNGMELLA